MLERFVAWLADTPWSIALHESLYMYSITESAHVMAIMLFAGTIAMVDLRLLGVAFRQTPASQMLARMLPWTVAGFVVLFITGVMLFYAIPVRTWHSLWFRIKCLAILIAGVNIAYSTFRMEKGVEHWDTGPVPRKAKIVAVLSLSMWATVIITGRLIAYNWTDCDTATSPIVLQLEGCPAEAN